MSYINCCQDAHFTINENMILLKEIFYTMTCIIKSLLIKYILLYRITNVKIFSMRTFLTTRQHSEYIKSKRKLLQ